MPQPYGTIYANTLNEVGEINRQHTYRRTGVCDVGTYTVDLALDDEGEFAEGHGGAEFAGEGTEKKTGGFLAGFEHVDVGVGVVADDGVGEGDHALGEVGVEVEGEEDGPVGTENGAGCDEDAAFDGDVAESGGRVGAGAGLRRGDDGDQPGARAGLRPIRRHQHSRATGLWDVQVGRALPGATGVAGGAANRPHREYFFEGGGAEQEHPHAQTSLPFNAIESRFLIGLTFRFMLRDIIFSSQRRHSQGVLDHRIRTWRRTPVYQEILEYSYQD